MVRIVTPHWAEYKQMSLLSVLQDQGLGCLLEIGLSALATIISFITSVLNEVGKCVRFFFLMKNLCSISGKETRSLIRLA